MTYTAASAGAIERGQAPRMRARLIAGAKGSVRSYIVVFKSGDHAIAGLTEWAEREGVTGGRVTATGAFASATFGWWDPARKAYRHIPIDGQVECIGLTGDIGLVNAKPQVHVHAAVGLSDGAMRGGHLIEAVVNPTLEVFVDVTPERLAKEKDAESAGYLFAL